MRIFQNAPRCRAVSVFDSRSFDAMIGAFKSSGGTARADDLALLLEEKSKGNFISVARQIVSRDIFSFEWQSHFWVPMFQFDHADMSVRQEVRRVVHELASVLDNWALAQWFTQPNEWLKNRRPVDMVHSHFSYVLDAARADRFVATG